MSDADTAFGEDSVEAASSQELKKARDDIEARCKSAGLQCEEVVFSPGPPGLRVGINCARDIRWLYLAPRSIIEFSSVAFEKWRYLSEYDAIYSYQDGDVEASIRPVTGFMPSTLVFQKLFSLEKPGANLDSLKIVLDSPPSGLPRIEISAASEIFKRFTRSHPRARPTLKLSGCDLKTHDQAVDLLKKVADSLFFQIDLLSGVALSLGRDRRGLLGARKRGKAADLMNDLQYPKTQFDDAPLSLYWYGRSATGMPLLQFLALYQVIEFYFPIYSQAEAQRKVRAILKDPIFRGDRDADIGRLLSSIRVSRRGAFGDERSQLRATLTECVDAQALREFLELDPDRKEFYLGKVKGSSYHRIPLTNPTADLRSDVADRMYDIRCKIVHTKNESGEGDVELLLPFSKEAEQLSFEVELVQYLAQAVLIAGSLPFQTKG